MRFSAALARLQDLLAEMPDGRAWSAAAAVNQALTTLEIVLTGGAANPVLRAWYDAQEAGAQFGSGLEAARRRVLIAVAELERAAAE